MIRSMMLSQLFMAALCCSTIFTAAATLSADDCINGNCGGGSGAGAGYASYFGGGAAGGAHAFGQTWGAAPGARDCNRFYHYPYVYYPQNFYGSEYYRSSNSMYYRYPTEMQIPVYNRGWHNEYPSPKRYHSGHHFLTDVF